MKFILDGMLGKLARWLRMMGYDAKYSNSMGDLDLLSKARDEERVLLTRDFALYQQASEKGIMTFYVDGVTEPERLAELADRFQIGLTIDLKESRCPKCNTKIIPISKKQVANKVKENTFANYEKFWLCPNCEAVYWQGAHWKNIHEVLKKAKTKKEADFSLP